MTRIAIVGGGPGGLLTAYLLETFCADLCEITLFEAGPRLGGYLAIDWGLERTEKWIKTLIDQRKLLITTSPVSNFLKTGERQLAVAESVSGGFLMNKDGLNVGYRIMEMVPATQFVLGQVKQAPYPNAARLLVDFLTSEDGQRVLQKADYLPAMPSVPAMKSGLRPEDGGFKATFLKPDEIHDRIPGWIKIVGELFR